MTRKPLAPDKLAVTQLQDALAACESAACNFFACPGPASNIMYGMRTCTSCYATILLRRALKRMNIERYQRITE